MPPDVGSLDGRNDARSWETYNSVLDAWRHGEYAARFTVSPDDAGARVCLVSWAGLPHTT